MKNLLTLLLLLPLGLAAQFQGGPGDGFNEESFSFSASLPLSILSFSATAVSDRVAIKWQTEDEVDTDLFLLERSPDAAAFTTIATLPAAGNARGQRLDYTHSDPTPLPGSNYYRLTTRDFDGSITRSPIVQVRMGDTPAPAYSLYPNPVARGQLLSVHTTTAGPPPMVFVFDQAGRQRLQSTTGKIDTSSLPAGAYLLRLSPSRDAPVSRLVIITN